MRSLSGETAAVELKLDRYTASELDRYKASELKLDRCKAAEVER